MSPRRRLALLLVAAFGFGLFAAWAKGQNTDGRSSVSALRSVLGNLSAPLVLVAFVAGAQAARLRSAALLGLAATMLALTGFYILTTLVIELGGHGFVHDLRRELAANGQYFKGGLLTGLLFGGVGGGWARTRSVRAGVVVGGLMMAEPVLLVIGKTFFGAVVPSGFLISVNATSTHAAVYATKFIAGVAVVVVAARRGATGLGELRGKDPAVRPV